MEQSIKDRFKIFLLTCALLISILPCEANAQKTRTLANGPDSFAKLNKLSQDTLTQIGRWGWGECSVVTIKGNYAFVGNGTLLQIYNISNPSNPQLVGEVNVSNEIYAITISENYAYITPDLITIDISDVTQPKIISRVHVSVATRALAVEGNYAFVGNLYGNIFTIDISDHFNPVILNNGLPTMTTQGEGVVSIVVVDTVLYASSATGTVVDAYNISNESSPVHIPLQFGYAGSITRQGNYLYLLVGRGLNALYMYDITDLAKPRYVTGINLNPDVIEFSSVSIVDTLAFVWEYNNGIEIVDIADTSNPKVLSHTPYLYNFPKEEEIGPVTGAFFSGVAYIASGNGLWLTDINNATALKTITYINTGSQRSVPAITLDSSHYTFLAEEYGGLKILDISNAPLPTLVGEYNPDEALWDISVSKDRAYLLCDSDLVVLNISNISEPKLESKITFGDTLNSNNGYTASNKLLITDSVIYVIRTSQHLYAVSVVNPSIPIITSMIQTIGVPIDIAKSGNYLYVANADEGIQVINIEEPQKVKQSGIIGFNSIRGLNIDGTKLFALTDSGFTRYEITDSTDLKPEGSCKIPSGLVIGQIKYDKTFAYVCYNQCLLIIDYSDINGPNIVHKYQNANQFNSFGLLGNDIILSQKDNNLLLLQNNLLTGVRNNYIVAKTFFLHQNFPNPFNPTTKIVYDILKTSPVTLKVYDILGKEIKTLVSSVQLQGEHSILFDARNLPSGIFFYQLQSSGQKETKKMLLIR